MSTSDPQSALGTITAEQPAAPGGIPSLPPGLPDPAEIARLANEFFTALHGNFAPSQPNAAPQQPDVSSLATPPVTAPAFPPEISLPSDPQLPTLPASVGPQGLSPLTAPIQVGPPAVPGAVANLASTGVASGPSYSFLQDARPIFSDTPHPASPAYPEALPISQFSSASASPAVASAPSTGVFPGLQAAPTSADAVPAHADLPQRPQPSSSALTPIAAVAPRSPGPSFGFLEELRPLFSDPPSVPGPVPTLPQHELAPVSHFDLPFQTDYSAGRELDQIALDATLGIFDDHHPLETSNPRGLTHPAALERDVPQELSLSSYIFDAESLKQDFPILRETVHGHPLVWLDNAATTQKPKSVIDRITYFYEHENSNVHRAAHEIAARATDAYEAAREKVRRFVNAASTDQIVFVRGTTEGINFIAQSWGRRFIEKDDEIIITWLEHHANIVAWQMLCQATGAKLRVAPVDDTGQVLLNEYEQLFNARTKLVSMTQVSNALGTVTPAREMIEIAHRYGAKVLLDGAQSVSHMRVDVQSLDCDFFVFSGHKVFGPTGIGVVYGKPEILASMPPWQGGGNMIQDVTHEKTIYHPPPQRFEAGTGNIADAVGLGAAIDYLDRVGMDNISRHEHELLVYATHELSQIPGLTIIGMAKDKAGVISFVLDGYKTEEVGGYLNTYGIAVRSGHHCAQPILRRFGLEATVRASLALYNTHEDIDKLVEAVWNLRTGHTSLL